MPSLPQLQSAPDAQERWTGHQYGGIDGPLCLEWGPDNWHSDITGAQMLESTYRLLHIENPLGHNNAQQTTQAPSRHRLTPGQAIRAHHLRFYIGNQLQAQLTQLVGTASGTFRFTLHMGRGSWRALVHDMSLTGEMASWGNDAIPKTLCGTDENLLNLGIFFKTNLDACSLNSASGMQALQALLCQAGVETDALEQTYRRCQQSSGLFGVLLLDSNNVPHFFLVFDDGGTLPFTLVQSEAKPQASRTPESYKELAKKSVGIVGLGSVGSKVALTLARLGIGRLYLVDHDLYLPENIERHVLDWSHVGEHKVDGIREVVARISARLNVEVSNIHLTGQESSAVVSGVLSKLGQCDALIDATANPRAFNLMTAVATTSQIPLIWTEVYAGGFGGMMARSRPGVDPDPLTMRAVYDQYCLAHPAPEFQATHDYATEDDTGRILTASDADVAIIAHHVTRFAVNTMLRNTLSIYPYSIYLIGLERWWVFEAPLHTIPIDTAAFRRKDTEAVSTPDDAAENLQFLAELLKKSTDAASASS
jgi:sulfur-carrier protein adenylyltransferase/sulfurtransferase